MNKRDYYVKLLYKLSENEVLDEKITDDLSELATRIEFEGTYKLDGFKLNNEEIGWLATTPCYLSNGEVTPEYKKHVKKVEEIIEKNKL